MMLSYSGARARYAQPLVSLFKLQNRLAGKELFSNDEVTRA